MSVEADNTTSGAIVAAVATATAMPDIESQQIQTVTAVATPLTLTDIEFQQNQIVTAIATPLPDIDSQQNQVPPAGTVPGNPTLQPTPEISMADRVGASLCMVALLTIANIMQIIMLLFPSTYDQFPVGWQIFIYLVCIIAAIAIASCLTCGCCCSDSDINPKFAAGTLVTLILAIFIPFAWFFAGYGGYVALFSLSIVLSAIALIVSCLFTWGMRPVRIQ